MDGTDLTLLGPIPKNPGPITIDKRKQLSELKEDDIAATVAALAAIGENPPQLSGTPEHSASMMSYLT